jgi:DNA-binding response OmpR family regulator
MFRIMVVDDDPNIRKLMSRVLERSGYEAVPAKDGNDALDILDKKQVDLIVLDIMMPGKDGFTLTEEIRSAGMNIPILMVTAKEAAADKKRGFIVGTDDYMVKPVDEEEFILRIAALLRRSKIASEHRLTVGETVLDYDAFTVYKGRENKTETLPQKEFLLLFKLLSYPNKIYTRRQLMDELWDMDSDTDERTVDVHINRLRERFRDSEDFDIVTVRGLGYKAVKKI